MVSASLRPCPSWLDRGRRLPDLKIDLFRRLSVEADGRGVFCPSDLGLIPEVPVVFPGCRALELSRKSEAGGVVGGPRDTGGRSAGGRGGGFFSSRTLSAAILAQDPLRRPERIKKSPAPFVHAATQGMRQLLWEGYALFVAAYRSAAERLKAGDPAPPFPTGCFPPAMPFVYG